MKKNVRIMQMIRNTDNRNNELPTNKIRQPRIRKLSRVTPQNLLVNEENKLERVSRKKMVKKEHN